MRQHQKLAVAVTRLRINVLFRRMFTLWLSAEDEVDALAAAAAIRDWRSSCSRRWYSRISTSMKSSLARAARITTAAGLPLHFATDVISICRQVINIRNESTVNSPSTLKEHWFTSPGNKRSQLLLRWPRFMVQFEFSLSKVSSNAKLRS